VDNLTKSRRYSIDKKRSPRQSLDSSCLHESRVPRVLLGDFAPFLGTLQLIEKEPWRFPNSFYFDISPVMTIDG